MRSIFLCAVFLSTAAALDILISDFKVGVLAKDQKTDNGNLKSVPAFTKLSTELNAESSQRLYISFDILEKSDKSQVHPQQVFLRVEAENGEDSTFVVNRDVNGLFTHDAIFRTSVNALRGFNGKLRAYLLVGGANVQTPLNWHFADIRLNFAVTTEPVPKSQQVHYEARKEISHIFRQPESRPPVIISDLFTVVCLSPLFLLIGLWSRIGVNFDNVPSSLWSPIFHAGLTGIFGLYFFFWIQLDMFETLKFLVLFGFVTFVAGNRVLRALAGEKMKSE